MSEGLELMPNVELSSPDIEKATRVSPLLTLNEAVVFGVVVVAHDVSFPLTNVGAAIDWGPMTEMKLGLVFAAEADAVSVTFFGPLRL